MGNNIQNTRNTIDINGKRYDAVSGTFLRASDSIRPIRRSVDGFVPVRARQPMATNEPVVKRAPRSPHIPGAHAAAHKPAPARTLMRSAVKKPSITAPSVIKAQSRTDILAKAPTHTIAPKLSHASVDPIRMKKAVQMSKSPSVSRYSQGSVSSSMPSDGRPAGSKHPNSVMSVASAVPASTIPVIPVTPVSDQPRPTDIFERALARATSHEQTYNGNNSSRKGRRLRGFAAGALGVLLIVGIIAYFNAPALSLKMASTRAGFTAKLPSYSPIGYQFRNLSYGPGNVTVSYKNTDNKGNFDITQKESTWDSQALLSNFVDTANKAYQTYERAGRTVYFFGNNTATWVDSGVWYTVSGNNSLTKNQLLDLAGSI